MDAGRTLTIPNDRNCSVDSEAAESVNNSVLRKPKYWLLLILLAINLLWKTRYRLGPEGYLAWNAVWFAPVAEVPPRPSCTCFKRRDLCVQNGGIYSL
jgi:hypothetical protein